MKASPDNYMNIRGGSVHPPLPTQSETPSASPRTRTNESDSVPPAREHHGADAAGRERSPLRRDNAATENEDEMEEMKIELCSDDEEEGPMASVEQTLAANHHQEPKGRVETVGGGEAPRSDEFAALMHEVEDEGDKRENASGINLPQGTAKSTVAAQPMSTGQHPSTAASSRAPMSPPSPSQRTPRRPQQADGGREAASGRANQRRPATAAASFPRVLAPSSRPARPSREARGRNDQGGRNVSSAGGPPQQHPDQTTAPPPNLATSPPSDDDENTQPPPTLEATLVQSAEATLIDPNHDAGAPNNFPLYEATRVTDVERDDDSWWKQYKKYIFVGSVALIIGALVSAVVMLAGRGSDGAGGDAPPSQETLLTTPATSPPAFMFSARPSPQLSMNVDGPTSKFDTLDPTTRPSLRPSFRPTQRPVPATVAPTPKPSLSPMTELQSSALELLPDEEIVSHPSSTNVAIHGNTAVIGAPDNDNKRGFVLVYVKDDNDKWLQQAKLVAPDGTAGDRFGWSVGIHGDTIIVGAHGDDDNGSDSGSAHVFVRDGVAWMHLAKLVAPDGAADDRFGHSVGIHDNTLIIGAYRDDDNGDHSGSVHLFVRNGNAWTHQAKLVAPDGAAYDKFGRSVGIFGDAVVIGAFGDDDNGSAYLFDRNNDAWTYQAKLLAPDGAALDDFGWSVAISGDTVVVGAYGDEEKGTDSGSAYVFARINDTWTYQAKLVAPDGAAEDYFGLSVAIHGDVVIVGSYWDDDIGENSGSAHAFVRNGAAWTHHAKLLAPRTGEGFGLSVGIYDGTIISGSYSGEAYVFSG